jgi:hypothetical protein
VQVPPVEEVMVMHEEVVGPREEVEDELVLTVVEQEVEVEDGEEEEEEEGEDVLEVVVDHAEPVSMIARTVASVENLIACVLSPWYLSISLLIK